MVVSSGKTTRILTAKDYRSKRRRLARELAELRIVAAPEPAALMRWESKLARLWEQYATTSRLTRKQRPRCGYTRQSRSRCGAPPVMRERLPANGQCLRHGGDTEPRQFPFKEVDFDLELTHVPGKPTVMAPPKLRVFVGWVEVDADEWLACALDDVSALPLVGYA